MRDRYPISGIKQSYRVTPERRTVIIPIAITLLLGGLIAFFFFGKTPPEMIPEEIVSGVEIGAGDNPGAKVGNEREIEAPSLAARSELEVSPLLEEQAGTPSATRSSSLTLFTRWMSPLALDSYIRQKNAGFEQTFWKRGHWITAVEGRWEDGTHEFRIAYERIPNPSSWQWQYRANQTPEEFHKNAFELRSKGFALVQSQSFDHPDRQKRYQAVWQKEVSRTTVTVTSEPQTALNERIDSERQVEDTGEFLTENSVPPGVADNLSTPESPRLTVIPESQVSRTLPLPETEGPRIQPRQPDPPASFGSSALDVNQLNFR